VDIVDKRFEIRKQELLDQCDGHQKVFKAALERLKEFAAPYLECFVRREQKGHAHTYLAGLLSDLGNKNVESIAYLNDEERRELQHFMGESEWNHRPLVEQLAQEVQKEIGEADGVLVFDPSGHAKSGKASVGVKRQWCGRLGKVDNCQVGIYMGYASRQEHALVDVRLYFPREWARDKERRKKCRVPKEERYCTRHELALRMLAEKENILTHQWVAGDDEMGRSSWFRGKLRGQKEQYLLAVPSNTTVRDLEEVPPPREGRGRPPVCPFQQVRRWREKLAEESWQRIHVRDGEKGPLEVECVKRRVLARTDKRRVGPEELLFITRTVESDGSLKHDYYLSNAPPETPLKELARVAKAEHRIEECLERAKGEAGLSDYELRTWPGWYHHQVLSMVATWFLIVEELRGKKMDARDHRAGNTCGLCSAVA
jgi:SRSO17 transposase